MVLDTGCYTLTLWVNPASLGPDQDMIEVMRAAYACDRQRLQSFFTPKDAFVASAVWHEQRHFFDFLFTNYGAFRMRQAFNQMALAETIRLKSKGNSILCPVDLYLDPIECEARNVPPIDDKHELFPLIKQLNNFRGMHALDNTSAVGAGGRFTLGGEAQLEALAVISQWTATEVMLDYKAASAAQIAFQSNINTPKYSWQVLLPQALGLALEDTRLFDGDVLRVNIGFLVPLLIASLMIRGYGQRLAVAQSEHSLMPRARLATLVENWAKHGGSSRIPSVEESWTRTNQVCKAVWGRTVLEELKEDYRREESLLRSHLAGGEGTRIETIRKCYLDHHVLRGSLIKEFESDELRFLDLVRFTSDILPKLRPQVIVASCMPLRAEDARPHGDVLSPFVLEDPNHVFDKVQFTYFLSPKWHDGRVHASGRRLFGLLPDRPFVLKEREKWLFLLSNTVPSAKLISNGRRHRLVVGAELEHARLRLKIEDEVDLVMHPSYRLPFCDAEASATLLRSLDPRTNFVCDFCEASIEKLYIAAISPWYRYHSTVAWQLWMSMRREGTHLIPDSFWKSDYRHLVACPSCLQKLTKAPEGRAAYLATGGRLIAPRAQTTAN